jgi:hypothetical protein
MGDTDTFLHCALVHLECLAAFRCQILQVGFVLYTIVRLATLYNELKAHL